MLMKKRHLSVLLLACLLILGSSLSALAAPPPTIRVLVIEAVSQLTISVKHKAFILTDENGKTFRRRRKKINIVKDQNGFRVNGEKFAATQLTVYNSSEQYAINNRSFRGKIIIHKMSNGKIGVVNVLPVEDYLVGIINSEISSMWPIESIKAQVVAARTYSLKRIQDMRNSAKPYDIFATTLDQVYHGSHLEDSKSRKAVRETRGETLNKQGKIFKTYYHSCCGGKTEHIHNVWPQKIMSASKQSSVIDKFCARSPAITWEHRISLVDLENLLQANNVQLSSIQDIATTQLPDSPRIDQVLIIDQAGLSMIKATSLRKWIGYKKFRSTWFNVGIENNHVVFAGRGYGHGVGMCQWGVKGMAEAGHSYKEILSFYYPNAQLATNY